jgi:YidC/Oxa1 family membrane protein insertase
VDRNVLLAFALSFLVLLTWSLLNPPPPKPAGQATQAQTTESAPEGVESEAQSAPAELPPLPNRPVAEIPQAPGEAPSAEREETILEFQRPGYRAELSTWGAALRHWELDEYDTGGDDPRPIVLTTGEAPYDRAGVTPFPELGLGDLSQAAWQVESEEPDGASFVLTRGGVTVRKTWRFKDSYTFRLKVDVENRSQGPVTTSFAAGWPAHTSEGNDFREQALVVLNDGKLQQQPLQGLGKGGFFGRLLGRTPQTVYDYSGGNDWAGMNTTYFLAALFPDDADEAQVRIVTLEPGKAGIAQVFFDPVRIPQGLALSREFKGYAGPKKRELLAGLGSHAERSINLGYSWVKPLTRFFGTLLHTINAGVGNYGVSIILLTLMVRAVTTPLTLKQMRSMERMRAVQPKLKEIQEKYKDDRQKQSEAMMALYRQEKVNPLGGCLPMVLQLPVFIGLFYALRSSIDLRQAPFVAWINDLSAPESLFVIPGLDIPVRVLPLVMGATMVLQQRITPMQTDPAQARMMMTIMPIMMTVIFYQFASGLVLYWMVSNVLAITHQLWVGRRMRTGSGGKA